MKPDKWYVEWQNYEGYWELDDERQDGKPHEFSSREAALVFALKQVEKWSIPHRVREPAAPQVPASSESDPTNPNHYKQGGLEAIDVIEAFGLASDFLLGNVVKYVLRAGKKDPAKTVEDLKKARWYLDRRIAKLSGAGSEAK